LNESKATLLLRNYYFDRDYSDAGAVQSQRQEWAQGFIFKATSGYSPGHVGAGLDVLGLSGVKLDSSPDRTGTELLPYDHDDGRAPGSYGRLGLTAKFRVARTELRLGELMPELPILRFNDGRLLPQTFQGVQLQSKDIDNLTLICGALNRARGRASTDLTGMAVNGGSQESDRFYFAGGDYRATHALTLQYYAGQLQDYYLQQFAGLNHVLALTDDSSLTTDLRYFRTRSDGANGSASGREQGYRVTGYSAGEEGEIDNDLWSAAFTYRLHGHSLTLGYQSVSDNSNFVQINQGSIDKGAGGSSLYLWTDKMLLSFTRAGERTRFAQYGYDFAALGVPGLKASLMYLKGEHIQTAGGAQQSEWERDFSLDYVIQAGTLKGLGVAWRNGKSHSEAARNGDQNRLILNYTLPIF